jgi:hypothetical protein
MIAVLFVVHFFLPTETTNEGLVLCYVDQHAVGIGHLKLSEAALGE